MKFLLVLGTLLAVSQALDYTAVVRQEWKLYKVQYGKEYSTSAEDEHRMEIYMENRAMIAEHNTKYEKGEVTFKMGVNQYSDMTHEEFQKMMGLLNSSDLQPEISGDMYVSPENVQIPDSMDWRKKGAVTPVKNQASCGSCWSFSATGSIEGQHFLKTGKLISLSEQNLIDCTSSYGNHGCGGGLAVRCFNYVRENGGIETEESYPYEAKGSTCRYNAAYSGASVTGYVSIAKGDEVQLKSAVANVGPISVSFDASLASFHHYSGGVYYDPKCSSTRHNHAVLVVGYGVEDGQDYWLVKNSWDTRWGEDGYFKIARNKNHCGIANFAMYPTV